MPKCINITLDRITCDFNGFGGSVLLNGDIFGSTFWNDPNNPGDLKETRKIYPFPGGPIRIAQGETVEIKMAESVTLCLSTPTTEPVGLNPKFLKIGGELNNGLASQFFTLDYLVQLPIAGSPGVEPWHKTLQFTAANLKMSLVFGLTMQNPW